MKILYLYMFPLWGNGSGAWLRAQAVQIAKNGHEVAIMAPERRKLKGIRHFVVTPPQMGVFVGNPELTGAKKYQDMNAREFTAIYTTYLTTAVSAVDKFKPDIVHAFHTAFLPSVARHIHALYSIKYLIMTHGSDLHYLSQDKRMIGAIKDTLRTASLITANSNFTRRWFLRMFGKEYSRKLRTIPGGVYIEQYDGKSSTHKQIDKKYGLKGKKVVLFTGRLTVHKGVEYLIKAARAIHGEVLILGDGPERSYLEKLIKKYKLNNTRILGYMNPTQQKQFRAFYSRADVYVAPSTWDETLGLVILEAMAAKTPVIVSRTGGVASLVKDGYNGYLVRARNSTQIAQNVNKLLANDMLREKMGQRAHDRVAERFTWDKIAQRFEHIYGRCLKNGNGKRNHKKKRGAGLSR